MTVLFAAVAQETVDATRVYFMSPGIEKALIYCLTGLGGLLGAWGTYWLARAWKLRNIPATQRRDDPRVLALEARAQGLAGALESVRLEMEARMAKLEGAVKEDTAKTERLRGEIHQKVGALHSELERKFDNLGAQMTELVGEVGEVKGLMTGLRGAFDVFRKA